MTPKYEIMETDYLQELKHTLSDIDGFATSAVDDVVSALHSVALGDFELQDALDDLWNVLLKASRKAAEILESLP